MKGFEYYKPETLSEARNLLMKHRGEAYIFNGGTDLIIKMREEITKPKAIIDIKGIEKLHVETTLVVGVIGFQCLGQPIDEEWVHRPKLFAEATKKAVGEKIDCESNGSGW